MRVSKATLTVFLFLVIVYLTFVCRGILTAHQIVFSPLDAEYSFCANNSRVRIKVTECEDRFSESVNKVRLGGSNSRSARLVQVKAQISTQSSIKLTLFFQKCCSFNEHYNCLYLAVSVSCKKHNHRIDFVKSIVDPIKRRYSLTDGKICFKHGNGFGQCIFMFELKAPTAIICGILIFYFILRIYQKFTYRTFMHRV